MDQQRLTYLLEQHRLNRLSPGERQELDGWYDQLDDPNFISKYLEGTPEAKRYAADQARQITHRVLGDRRASTFGRWMSVAAGLVGLLGLAMVSMYIYKNVFSHATQLPAVVHYDVTSRLADSRYVNLPDSSVVVLHAGSQLQVDTNDFNKEARRVKLKGEAYFDIAHNPAKPFVISVNDLTVTVLGTAFNIKQVGDSVAVTVTRGKVQVTRSDKTLAVLTPGKQLITSDGSGHNGLNDAQVGPVTAWMNQGLHFNNTTLAEVVAQLSERYNANIALKTPGIGHCMVNIATPLSGTESLNNVLDVICTILGANYINNNGKIEITGKPCNRE